MVYLFLLLKHIAVNEENQTRSQRWICVDITRGAFGPEDMNRDIVELRFEKPIPIKVPVQYQLLLIFFFKLFIYFVFLFLHF